MKPPKPKPRSAMTNCLQCAHICAKSASLACPASGAQMWQGTALQRAGAQSSEPTIRARAHCNGEPCHPQICVIPTHYRLRRKWPLRARTHLRKPKALLACRSIAHDRDRTAEGRPRAASLTSAYAEANMSGMSKGGEHGIAPSLTPCEYTTRSMIPADSCALERPKQFQALLERHCLFNGAGGKNGANHVRIHGRWERAEGDNNTQHDECAVQKPSCSKNEATPLPQLTMRDPRPVAPGRTNKRNNRRATHRRPL